MFCFSGSFSSHPKEGFLVTIGICGCCEKKKKLRHPHPDDPAKNHICSNCYNIHWLERVGVCAECKESKRLRVRHPLNRSLGMICNSCNNKLITPVGYCPDCQRDDRRLSGKNEDGTPVCMTCYKRSLGYVS